MRSDSLSIANCAVSSPFDLILHVAYGQRPLTRKERAEKVRKRNYFAKYGDTARAVLEGLLNKYQDEGVIDLADPTILRITPPFDQMGTPVQLVKGFGSKSEFEAAVHELQNARRHQERSGGGQSTISFPFHDE
jgi:type I restriction enzyme R subunit